MLKKIVLKGEQKKVLFLPPTNPIQIKGECVLINDVITNHVSGRWNQGDVYRLSKSEATWTGKDFYIKVSSYAIGEFIG